MNWFLLAFLAPVLWSSVNFIDKYLLSRYLSDRSTGSLILFSSLIGIVISPIIYFLNPMVLDIPLNSMVILFVVGILSAFAVLFYLFALEDEDVSIVVPLFQTIPIFGLLFGFLILGELPNKMQIIGIFSIVIGAILITSDFTKKIFNKKVFILMLCSSLIFGLYETMFKLATEGENFWIASFWEHLGLAFFGIVAFLFIKNWRKDFIHLAIHSGKNILLLNIGSEILTIVGNIITNYALLLVPVALVLSITGLQPFITLVLALIISKFLPKISLEENSTIGLTQKVLSITIMFIGVILIQ